MKTSVEKLSKGAFPSECKSNAMNLHKKHVKYFFAILVIGCSLPSCVIHHTTHSQEQKVCSLHKEKMKKASVRTTYGLGCHNGNTSDYPNAKAVKCVGCKVPIWPTDRFALVYHCKACNKLKKINPEKVLSQWQ